MKDYYDRSKLDPVEERTLFALSKRKVIKTWVLTLLWLAAVAGLWVYITVAMNRPVTHPGSFVFLLLLMLPFYPLRAHQVMFGKSFYATVGTADFVVKTKGAAGPTTFRQMTKLEYIAYAVTFYGEHGERKTVVYKEGSVHAKDGYYKQGDRVLVLAGLKFPVKCPMPTGSEKMLCPACGHELKEGQRHCGWCKADFGKTVM